MEQAPFSSSATTHRSAAIPSSLPPTTAVTNPVTYTLLALVLLLTTLYGLLGYVDDLQMSVRRDLSPLFTTLGSPLTAIPVVLWSSLVCLTPGELTLTLVILSYHLSLETALGPVRHVYLFLVLCGCRVLQVVAWAELFQGIPLDEVRLRPSTLWLCVATSTVHCLLLRDQHGLVRVLWGRVPLLSPLMLFGATLYMVLGATQLPSMWDTTIPAVACGWVVCSRFVGLQRWPTDWAVRHPWMAPRRVQSRFVLHTVTKGAGVSHNSSSGSSSAGATQIRRDGPSSSSTSGNPTSPPPTSVLNSLPRPRPSYGSTQDQQTTPLAHPAPYGSHGTTLEPNHTTLPNGGMAPTAAAVNATHVRSLMELGFSERQSVEALRRANGHVDDAAAYLMGEM